MKYPVFIALFAASAASATPWRQETGLPPAPEHDLVTGAPLPEPPPTTSDGVEHPVVPWRDFTFGAAADAFLAFRLQQRQGTLFSEFELTRVQLGGWATFRDLAGVDLTFETVRSSGARSYFGVDGDSIVPRVKWAYAEVTPLGRWLSLRAGLVPDLLIPLVEASWAFRVQGPTGLERDGLFVPGDLGATLEAALPWRLGSIAVAYGNGEGVRLREQNGGKNVTVAVHLTPLRARLPGLALDVLFRDGSIGAGSAADGRFSGGITYTGRRLGAGAIATWAIGYDGMGALDAAHFTAWARGELPYRFYLLARADLLWRDARARDDFQLRAIAGVAYALPALLRIVAGYEGTLPFGARKSEVPSIEEHALLVQIEARL